MEEYCCVSAFMLPIKLGVAAAVKLLINHFGISAHMLLIKLDWCTCIQLLINNLGVFMCTIITAIITVYYNQAAYQ